MKKRNLTSVFLLATAAAVIGTGPFWATDAKGAKEGLKEAGYTDVQIDKSYTNFGFLNCNSSTYSTTFNAKDPKGEAVEGYYCSGPFFKGTTVETTKTLKP